MSFFRFGLSDFVIKNDINQFPKIYSSAINVDNSERYYKQINTFFSPLEKRGHEAVRVAAYLDKWPYGNASKPYEFNEKAIMRKILPKARNNDHDVVFVWDIEDLTMLPVTHILELSMLRPDINATSLYMLQKRIYAFDDETEEMLKAAPMYDALRELYCSVKTNDDKENESIIPHDLFEKLGILEHKEELCQVAEKHQEVYHQRWKTAKKCMKLVNTRSAESKDLKFANVVLSNQGVASACAQLLVSSLSSEVDIENIFSMYRCQGEPNAWYRMKELVPRLKQKYGENCVLIHVTSGPIDAEIPFEHWPIRANDSFDYLYNFQRDTLLY